MWQVGLQEWNNSNGLKEEGSRKDRLNGSRAGTKDDDKKK
jgi:hypothetical protein